MLASVPSLRSSKTRTLHFVTPLGRALPLHAAPLPAAPLPAAALPAVPLPAASLPDVPVAFAAALVLDRVVGMF